MAASSAMWRVAITDTKSEFSVAKDLAFQGFETLLPYARTRVRIEIKVPRTRANPRPRALFKSEVRDSVRWPGYLFVEDGDDVGAVLKTRNVRGIVCFGNAPASVTREVIEYLRSACDPTGRLLTPAYHVGDILSFVASSPLAGLSGEVLRVNDASLTLTVGGRPVTAPFVEVRPT